MAASLLIALRLKDIFAQNRPRTMGRKIRIRLHAALPAPAATVAFSSWIPSAPMSFADRPGGVHFSKEFSRARYRGGAWYKPPSKPSA